MFLNTEGEYGKYILQDLHDPNAGTPEFREIYNRFAKRILWLDDNIIPGAIQMNTAWYKDVPERDPIFEEHTHEYDEIIAFFGSDPDNPYELNAELELAINGEWHKVTKSSLIYVPANMSHMPLSIKRVDKPIFHFSLVVGPQYNGAAYK